MKVSAQRLLCVALATIACVPAVVQARPAKVDRLLQLTTRPKPKHLLLAFGGKLPDENPFTNHRPPSAPEYSILKSIASVLPKSIANFEKAYPGATYAALGRDSVLMADVLSAYYDSIGQPGRIVRINASGGSFTGKAADIVDFLQTTTPLDFEHPARSRGFVVFDRTSYTHRGDTYRSQARVVMEAIYGELHRRGHDTEALTRKINIISFGPGYSQVDDAKLGTYFAAQQAHQANTPGDAPTAFLPTPGFSEDEAMWHDTFGKFTRKGQRVTTKPGKHFSLEHRETILWEQFEIMKLVRSPEFRRHVEEASKALGINAPHVGG